jgi:SAM-dependent methyltransferase
LSHPQQLNFISALKNQHPEYFTDKKVLEVGSLNINGSIRPFFSGCDYIGLDVGPGKNVDEIGRGDEYTAPNETFDVTVSCECFEHNPHWVETFKNMIRMTKPLGFVIITCATEGRPEHGTTRTTPADSPLTIGMGWDYYKNLVEKDFRENINLAKYFVDYNFIVNTESHDLYFYGIKGKKG